MNQAEVDCLVANTYIELALHADNKPRRRHYAAKGEVHSLRARQNRNQGGMSAASSTRSGSPRCAWLSVSPPSPLGSACTTSGSSLSSTGSPGFCRDLTGRYLDVPEVGRFREQARDYVRKAAHGDAARMLHRRTAQELSWSSDRPHIYLRLTCHVPGHAVGADDLHRSWQTSEPRYTRHLPRQLAQVTRREPPAGRRRRVRRGAEPSGGRGHRPRPRGRYAAHGRQPPHR
jgi:hypothetical protein